ncbi:hypothetical protein DL98DRAFT_658564 [Cadophora sp. DSE1049]|nr:hypothetical protein DL98DRAFT_658564 [Cadophora sp. DSE1049]
MSASTVKIPTPFSFPEQAREVAAAEALFQSKFFGFDDTTVPRCASVEPENVLNFWEYEALPMLNMLDVERVKETGVKVAILRGERSGEAWYAQTTVGQARILGREVVTMLVHHQMFEVEVEAFVPRFLDVINS